MRALASLGSTAAGEFARDPVGFAQLVAALLDLRRLIADPQLFDFLEDKYGIPLARRLPRVDGGVLRFTIAKMALGETPIVTDFAVDAIERTRRSRPACRRAHDAARLRRPELSRPS